MQDKRSFFWGVVVGMLGIYLLLTMRGVFDLGSLHVNSPSPFVGSGGDTQGDIQFEKYNFLYELLQETYYDTDKLDLEKMQESALKGFVNAIGDPFTVYLTPEENEIFNEGMQGSQNFEGIGAIVTKKEDGVMIETVLKGSPAFESGIKPLDLIIEINSEATSPLSLNEAVQMIRGEGGTEVVLTIYRAGGEETLLEIPVIRGEISVPSVEGEILELEDKKILHMTLGVFGDDTIRMFEEVSDAYPGVDGIILDMRGNGGGYLPTAVSVASHFLPKNEIVTVGKYSIYDDEVFRSKGYGTYNEIPTVVLVDELSASASEIIASSLQERGGATVVGQNTFGKGSIQTVHSNDDGSSLKFTIGKWYTPDDDNVDEVGVTPDVEIELDVNAYVGSGIDTQLSSAKEQIISLIRE